MYIIALDGDSGLLDFSISHLAGDSALPDEFVQTLLLCAALNLILVHVGWTDGLVSLLSTLRTGVIFAGLAVVFAIQVYNLLLAGV